MTAPQWRRSTRCGASNTCVESRTEVHDLERVHLIALIADAVALRRDGITSTGVTWADWDRAAARLLDQERS